MELKQQNIPVQLNKLGLWKVSKIKKLHKEIQKYLDNDYVQINNLSYFCKIYNYSTVLSKLIRNNTFCNMFEDVICDWENEIKSYGIATLLLNPTVHSHT